VQFTEEQQAAIDLAAKGENFSLVAPAGSGKSATAVGIAAQLKGKRILYVVYNTQAKDDAIAKFQREGITWVDVRTTSALGWRKFAYLEEGVGEAYQERMKPRAKSVSARDVARRVNLQEKDFGNNVILDGYQQAVLASEAIDNFANSSRTRVSDRDVRLIIAGAEQTSVNAARAYIARLAQALWNRSIMPGSDLRFTMQYAFKLLVEEQRDLGYDVVIIDEAQDSNDATMKFLEAQKGAQGIIIGDPAQTMYAWRGASDQILRYDAERLFLTQSFRFGPRVAEEAMKHLPHTLTGVTIKGLPSINDLVTENEMESPDIVLSRTNAGAMEHAISYLRAGKRVALVKGTRQIIDLAFGAKALMSGKRPNNLELSAFTDWGSFLEFTEEPGGGHLKALVKMINAYRIDPLIEMCQKMTDYRKPHDVAVSTCHSVKGLEWDSVQIADDFFEPDPFQNPLTGELEVGVIDKHEAMVHYVAVTRARRHLDRAGLSWIDGYSNAA
jgi:superfamily I DNA/RNA helicase